MTASERRLAEMAGRLRMNPGIVEGLSGMERAMAESALRGASVHAIAQEHAVSVEAVWTALGNAARLAGGRAAGRVEVGGLDSDTDPGIHGGYGDTGFGALDIDPPEPNPGELVEGDSPARER